MLEWWRRWENRRGDSEGTRSLIYEAIDEWIDEVYSKTDLSRGSDHYNNPDKENPDPDWTKNCTKTVKIKDHQFYKGP